MDNKGFASIAALWVGALLSTVALTALASARVSNGLAGHHLRVTRMLHLVNAVVVTAHATGFSDAVITRESAGERIRVERTFSDENRSALLDCRVEVGHTKKRVVIDWRRVGGQWSVVSWKETE